MNTCRLHHMHIVEQPGRRTALPEGTGGRCASVSIALIFLRATRHVRKSGEGDRQDGVQLMGAT